jgi:hypothetical protein
VNPAALLLLLVAAYGVLSAALLALLGCLKK